MGKDEMAGAIRQGAMVVALLLTNAATSLF